MNVPSYIQPGDCLLYGPSSWYSYIIMIKTWGDVCHCELYIGEGKSVASRDGKGVAIYPFREAQLKHVLRPNKFFNLSKALTWFNEKANGQKYDWLGLLCFTLAVKRGSPNKMFCSEFLKRMFQKGDFNALHENWDADKTAPVNFEMSPNFNWIK